MQEPEGLCRLVATHVLPGALQPPQLQIDVPDFGALFGPCDVPAVDLSVGRIGAAQGVARLVGCPAQEAVNEELLIREGHENVVLQLQF